MKHQLRLCADQDRQPRSVEHAMPLADPRTSGAAGAAGLWWLWGVVELRLSQAEPDSAA